MAIYCGDIEGDGLLDTITKVWCMSLTECDEDNNFAIKRSYSLTDYKDIKDVFGNPDNILIMHNGLSYDGPAAELVFSTKTEPYKVKAEIIDSLILSWYLYPKLVKHGLDPHGEALGIAKPKIDNWEDLSLEEYIHRCEEDVKIQYALWKMIWKHMMLLYETEEASWRAIRHLNFKAKCAAMQQESRWKLDVERTKEAEEMFSVKYEAARVALEARMPKVPIMKTKSKPKKCYKANGDLSALGLKWAGFCQIMGVDFDTDKDIPYQDGEKEPNAGSSQQMKAWLGDLGWVPQTFKYDRNKETNEVRMIPQIKDADTGELCPSVEKLISKEPALEYLREMTVVKHRLGVVEGFLRNVDSQGYVQALVQGLTNTIRFKHKVCVNLPSVRKPYGELIRSLLIARNDGLELCGSDMSSLEDRTKQHYMWPYDPEYVKEMMKEGFDPHLDMALAAGLVDERDVLFYKSFNKESANEADYARHKDIADNKRHPGKSTNYAATYGAKGPTIARSAGVSEALGSKLYDAYWARNWSLIAIADNCIVKQSRGLKWLWNPVAKLWIYLKADKDKFSTLNQSTGTYCFDRWLYYVIQARPQLTAQFHDEGIWELKKGNREAMTKILKDAIQKVNEELNLNRDLDCDVAFGPNYAEIH